MSRIKEVCECVEAEVFRRKRCSCEVEEKNVAATLLWPCIGLEHAHASVKTDPPIISGFCAAPITLATSLLTAVTW